MAGVSSISKEHNMKRTAFTSLTLATLTCLAAGAAFAQPGQPGQTAPAQSAQLDQSGEIAVLGERIETLNTVAEARQAVNESQMSAMRTDYNSKIDVMRAESNASFERLRTDIANLGLTIIMWMIAVGAALFGVPWLRERWEKKPK